MAKKGGYTLGEYQGGYSTLDPNKTYGEAGFTGYRARAGSLGASTKPDTANQIQEVNKLLNQGMVPIEVGALDPGVFDQIPKKHFKEMNRMAKLTGSKLSVHAPIVEPSGIGKQGWSEENRRLTERQLNNVVEKAFQISDKERVPITIHSTEGLPGSEWIPKEGTGGEEGKIEREKIIAVNQETGEPTPLIKEEKHYPKSWAKGGKRITSPEDNIQAINETSWQQSLNELIHHKEDADRILSQNYRQIEHLVEDIQTGNIDEGNLTPKQQEARAKLQNADAYLEDASLKLSGLFDKAYKYAQSEEDKKKLWEASKEYKNMLGIPKDDMENYSREELMEMQKKRMDEKNRSRALQYMIGALSDLNGPPQQYVPIEDFAVKHSSKTFGNVALNAYKKYGKKAPMINIENMYTGMAFSGNMDDINNLIKNSKQEFVQKATKPKEKGGLGLSESKAKKAADDMIGMTLDLGHLNIAKKKGFSDKYLTEQAKKVAENVKHVHMADNFGYSDSHLPPGMGNVPNKELLEELEKQGRTEEMRKIVEAGGFVQHFGTSPHPYSLEGMGSPMYQEGEPYWNQAIGLQQGYGGGFGQMLPQGHFETYGIPSFSNLPSDLGGQRMGAGGSRMSGRQME